MNTIPDYLPAPLTVRLQCPGCHMAVEAPANYMCPHCGAQLLPDVCYEKKGVVNLWKTIEDAERPTDRREK